MPWSTSADLTANTLHTTVRTWSHFKQGLATYLNNESLMPCVASLLPWSQMVGLNLAVRSVPATLNVGGRLSR